MPQLDGKTEHSEEACGVVHARTSLMFAGLHIYLRLYQLPCHRLKTINKDCSSSKLQTRTKSNSWGVLRRETSSLKSRKVKQLAQGHTASWWQNWK